MLTVADAIFDEEFDFRRRVAKVLTSDFWLWLTVFRFCPGRSTLTPIAALEENLRFTTSVAERRLLIRKDLLGTYFLLHAIGFVVELMVVVFLVIVLPFIFNGFQVFDIMSSWYLKAVYTSTFVAFSLVGPFYVCSGFSLYLNRRIELEGWDIDIGFRRILNRIAPTLVIVCCILGSLTLEPQEKSTNENSQRVQVGTEVQNIIDSMTEERRVRFNSQENTRNESDFPILRLVAWILLGGLAAWLVFTAFKLPFADLFKRKTGERESLSTSVSSLEERLELPSNVLATATREWNSGNKRDAVSLLYRGALHTLIVRDGCNIDPSDTEASCIREVYKSHPNLLRPFKTITTLWQQLAYANVDIDDTRFEILSHTYAKSFL